MFILMADSFLVYLNLSLKFLIAHITKVL